MNEDNVNNTQIGKEKPVLPILFAVVAIVCVGFASFFLFTNKDNDKSKNNVVLDEEKKSDEYMSILNDLKYNDEKRTGKKITIYRQIYNDDGAIRYGSEKADEAKNEIIGSVTCFTNKCELIESARRFVIVFENNEYSIYDYIADKLVYKALITQKSDDDNVNASLLIDLDQNIRGAVGTINESKSVVYSFVSNSLYNNIDGVDIDSVPRGRGSYTLPIFVSNNLVLFDILNEDNPMNYSVISLTDGNIIYTIKGDYYYGYAVGDSKSAYMVVGSENNEYLANIKDGNIINKNFDKMFNNIIFKDGYFYTHDVKNTITKYDRELQVLGTTKAHKSLKFIDDAGFAVAVNDTNLQLFDLDGNLLTTFITDYNEKDYNVSESHSGWWSKDGKAGYYVVVKTKKVTIEEIKKDNPELEENEIDLDEAGYEYYYIPKTKETGKFATPIFEGGYAKPVLYLYPEKTTNVTVTFAHNDWLTTTYPKFNNSWNVTVNPNGNMTDSNGRTYYALYWEEKLNHNISFDTGFYVEGKDAIKFLEEKLAIIGLNEREANEFIMYWLPILEKNDKNLIYFELTEERDLYNKLNISPKPDSVLRMAMHVKKVDKKTLIKEQKLTSFNRNGFTAIEWGGQVH